MKSIPSAPGPIVTSGDPVSNANWWRSLCSSGAPQSVNPMFSVVLVKEPTLYPVRKSLGK